MLYTGNKTVEINGDDMDYVTFGKGSAILIIIPGLGDGLRTVKGMAWPLAFMYREFAKDYTVYIFSRKRTLPQGCTSRDMAKDLVTAMKKLKIERADILGISQGGTIAQYIAVDYPEAVNKLVLAVTYARTNETLHRVITKWIDFAKASDYKSLMIDTAEKTYSEKYLKRNRKFYPLLTRFCLPKSYERFLIMAEACLTHDSFDSINRIDCPTLIIGGKEDKIVTGEASEEMAKAIPGSKILMYEELGHGVYEEARDFNREVLRFLRS